MFIHLGQWNLNFPEGSRLAIIRSSGLLGVELTYIINAYFYSKKFDQVDFSYKNVLKMFLGLIPVYYFGLILYGVSTYAAQGNLGESNFNVLSHFFFLNGLYCPWWKGYMGGTGYFGVLAIMWVIFPLYLKKVNGLKESLLYGSAKIGIFYLATRLLMVANMALSFDTTGSFGDFMNYINRGGYCFALGNILYYVLKEHTVAKSSKSSKIFSMIFSIMIFARMIIQGSGFDGFLFAILCCVLILLNYKESLCVIDNPVFAFCGKNITELFVAHIVLYYVLVQNQKLMVAGTKTFVILFALSFIVAPILKACVSKPFSKLLYRLFNI